MKLIPLRNMFLFLLATLSYACGDGSFKSQDQSIKAAATPFEADGKGKYRS